jgi:hypothetical protein
MCSRMLGYNISRASNWVSNRAPQLCYPCVSPHGSHSSGLRRPAVTQKALQSMHEEAMEVSCFSLWPVCLLELSLTQIDINVCTSSYFILCTEFQKIRARLSLVLCLFCPPIIFVRNDERIFCSISEEILSI